LRSCRARSARIAPIVSRCPRAPDAVWSGIDSLGPLTPGSAATLRWNGTSFVNINNSSIVAGSGTSGTANEFDPYNIAEFSPAQQRNGATMTIDQRLTRDITFVGEAFYSNRRSQWISPSNISRPAITI